MRSNIVREIDTLDARENRVRGLYDRGYRAIGSGFGRMPFASDEAIS